MVAAMVPRGQQVQDLAVRYHKADFVVKSHYLGVWGELWIHHYIPPISRTLPGTE